MTRKKILPALAITLIACATLFAQEAEAKTIKKMVVKSINQTEKTLKAIKNGDTYNVTATNAKIRKGSNTSKSMTFSQVKEGDVITVEGSFDGTDVTATKIRDLSYYDKNTTTFYGKIETINAATNTVEIETLDRGDLVVSVLKTTEISNEDEDTIALSDLKEDDRILVTGKWSRKKDTITKTKTIDVLDDDDYDDLDD